MALLIYFWRDWLGLLLGFSASAARPGRPRPRRLALLIVVATIPAVILGYVFEPLLPRAVRHADRRGRVPGAERADAAVRRTAARDAGASGKPLARMTFVDALTIGIWQCGALFPGISRSGATIVGGLLRGLNHVESAHFSFLIAPRSSSAPPCSRCRTCCTRACRPGVFQQALLAAVVAGITAWLATAFLMRYFRDHDDWALSPFAVYCLVVGRPARPSWCSR